MMDAGKAYRPADAGSIYVPQSLFDPGFISGRIINKSRKLSESWASNKMIVCRSGPVDEP